MASKKKKKDNKWLLNLLALVIIIEIAILAIGLPNTPAQPTEQPANTQATTEVIPQGETATPAPTPEPTYPKPSYIPTMRSYEINKDNDIWRAQDPSSYITPDNEWVKYYASQLYIDNEGRIRYKNKPIPQLSYINGTVILWTDEPFVNNYISDNKQFDFPPNEDMWVMPEYYLTHGLTDDCDGWAVTLTSIMLSGEMSVYRGIGSFHYENKSLYYVRETKFIKQIIPAKAVLGYFGGKRDMWVEYEYQEVDNDGQLVTRKYVSSTSRRTDEFVDTSITLFNLKNNFDLNPVFEFDNKHFGVYK